MQRHQLRVLGVVENELVGVRRRAVLRAPRLQAALGRLRRQLERRLVRAVVDDACHERAVGVVVEVRHDHLHPDAGQKLRAKLRAGERLRHADPAGALLVLLAVAVPVKLHLDPAVFVGVDLLAGGPHDERRLHRAGGPGRLLLAPPHGLEGHGRKGVFVFKRPAGLLRGLVGAANARGVTHAGQEILLPLLRRTGVRLDLERVARREGSAGARARGDARRHLLGLDPHLRGRVAIRLLVVFTRIVEQLGLVGVRIRRLPLARREQIGGRLLEVVVGLDELPGPVGIVVLPCRQLPRLRRRAKLLHRLDIRVGAVGEGGVGVGDDHRQRLLAVLEVVGNPLELHQPADEGEVGLPILHAVIPRRVAARDLLRERDVGRVAEHIRHDVGNRFLLEDLAVARERGEPEARHHLHEPAGEHVVAAHPREAAHVAGEPARRVVGVVDPEAYLLADDTLVAQRFIDR